MKKFLYIIIINLFFVQLVNGSSCDSTVVEVSKSQQFDSSWSLKNISYSIFRDGLLREKLVSDNPPVYYFYLYDSLNRVSEIYQDSSFHNYFYYNSSGKDSVSLRYYFNGTNYYPSFRESYSYDINNNLDVTLQEFYDSTSMNWDSSAYIISYYSPDSLTRTDSIHLASVNQVNYRITTFDSAHHIVGQNYNYNMIWGSSSFEYSASCINFPEYFYSVDNTAGPLGATNIYIYHWTFDTLCRPLERIDTNVIFQDRNTYTYLSRVQYYYADCNSLVAFGEDTIVSCNEQLDVRHLEIIGGVKPYSFLWTPNDSISNDTIKNAIFFTDTLKTFQLSIHDSIGNSANYQLVIFPTMFTDTVRDASCATCNDGEIQINFNSPPLSFNPSVSPISGIWNGTTLSGLAPGDYNICLYGTDCAFCDSIHVGSLISVEEIRDGSKIKIFPNPADDYLHIFIIDQKKYSKIDWSLIDPEGRLISNKAEYQNQFEIPLDNISSGIYFLEITTDRKMVYRFVVR
jgi:hypothetical protein